MYSQLLDLITKNRQEFIKEYISLHTQDQAVLFTMLSQEDKFFILHTINTTILADIFEQLDNLEIIKLIEDKDIPNETLIKVLNDMESEEIVDLIDDFDFKKDLEHVLSVLNKDKALEIKELLKFDKNSSGRIMSKKFAVANLNDQIKFIMKDFIKIAPDIKNINYIYITTDENVLCGVISLKQLILSRSDDFIRDIMSTNLVTININDRREDVAHIISDYNLFAVPIIDENEKIKGIITVDDVIDIINEEADEDFEQLSGVKYQEQMTIKNGILYRTPWLIMLLLLSLFNSRVYGLFNTTLSAVPSLAIYMPLIAGMAGNVGTQNLALSIRRLTNDESYSKFNLYTIKHIFKELKLYATIGLIIASFTFVIITLFNQEVYVAISLSISIFVAFLVATLLGSFVPIIMEKLDVDPAVSSGPIITTINDLISIVIYLSISTLLLNLLI